MSIAGGYEKAVQRAHSVGCDCVQIFTKNGNTMGICPKCKTNLKVPITLDRRTTPRKRKRSTSVKSRTEGNIS